MRLGRAESDGRHPIRTFYDHGVRVTVHTDAVALFDQGVPDETYIRRAGFHTRRPTAASGGYGNPPYIKFWTTLQSCGRESMRRQNEG